MSPSAGDLAEGAREALRARGFPLDDAAIEAVANAVGVVRDIVDLHGGIVHHVARVVGAGGTVVLKRRGRSCWGLPDRPLRPADAEYEGRALALIERVAPGAAPRLLHYDQQHATLIMGDLGELEGCEGTRVLTLVSAERARVVPAAATALLARLHARLEGSFPRAALRDDGDREILERNVSERIAYHGVDATERLATAVRALPRQLILGDFSPKNLVFDEDDVRVFDLEHVHRGARCFDLAFFLGHVVLHRSEDEADAADAASTALRAYEAALPLDEVGRQLLGRLVASTILYRIRNPVVPYETSLSANASAALGEALLEAIADEALPLAEVVSLTAAAHRA